MRKVVPIKVFTEEGIILPQYAKPGDSGMDVRAKEPLYLEAGETKIVWTGIFMEIPDGYEIQARPRSGVSFKTKFRVANSPGTIDSCYRGELGIIIDNIGSTKQDIAVGERIAQIVLAEVPQIEWVPVPNKYDLTETERGEGRTGSTGTH